MKPQPIVTKSIQPKSLCCYKSWYNKNTYENVKFVFFKTASINKNYLVCNKVDELYGRRITTEIQQVFFSSML